MVLKHFGSKQSPVCFSCFLMCAVEALRLRWPRCLAAMYVDAPTLAKAGPAQPVVSVNPQRITVTLRLL
jgi:hypothetical protein